MAFVFRNCNVLEVGVIGGAISSHKDKFPHFFLVDELDFG